MNAINVEHLVNRFGAVPSGDDVGLAVREGGIFEFQVPTGQEKRP